MAVAGPGFGRDYVLSRHTDAPPETQDALEGNIRNLILRIFAGAHFAGFMPGSAVQAINGREKNGKKNDDCCKDEDHKREI